MNDIKNINSKGKDQKLNSELQNFTISSGTTGEQIAANGANGVTTDQKASNIQVGRYAISATTGVRVAQLKDRCRARGLKVGGTKSELLSRLMSPSAEDRAGYRAPRRDPWPRRAIASAWGALVGLVVGGTRVDGRSFGARRRARVHDAVTVDLRDRRRSRGRRGFLLRWELLGLFHGGGARGRGRGRGRSLSR